jgi:hypothetical protein
VAAAAPVHRPRTRGSGSRQRDGVAACPATAVMA